MRFFSLLGLSLFAALLTGCSAWESMTGFFNPSFEEVDDSLYDDYDNSFEVINTAQSTAVVQDLAAEVKHMHHLHLQHAKTYYDGGIHAIQLQFISQDLIEMCEARKLIVDLTESFLAKLNQNPILATDFANYPFRPENLEIYITFESYFGKYLDPHFIYWICMEDGQIDYYIFDILDRSKNKWRVRHESYSTSREIVVYQREAERKYDELHYPKINVFGNLRYFPPSENH